MTRYLVEWSIEIDARSHRDAAEKALEIHRDPGSIATVFLVTEENADEGLSVDLLEEENETSQSN